MIPCLGGCGKLLPYIDTPGFDICSDCYKAQQDRLKERQRQADEKVYRRMSSFERQLDKLIVEYLDTCGYAVDINYKSHRYPLIRFVTDRLEE